ncbi:MAG TPA: HEAT repeat domain-containing protein [Vicinamibacterales bacterium]|nr:HEAT repeat domain-containing protein [Vicinamibacterales bacterium]
MAQASQLSPELSRGLLQLARALVAAARNWTLYPPEHPTVRSSVQRLAEAVAQSTLGAVCSIGVAPDTLLIESTPADRSQAGIAEAAALLHDRDLLRVTFVGDVTMEALHAFLRLLAIDAAERRAGGGPAQIWALDPHPSIAIEQIDYAEVLRREEGEVGAAARRDEVWRSIVASIAGGPRALFDAQQQERLLAVAGSARDIADLAVAVAAPKCAMDGSPMITTQAATVLAAFRHLTNIVSVMSPDRLPDVMGNLASAATQLDAHVLMRMMQTEEDPAVAMPIVQGLARAFDDTRVAQLLATALALDGQASDRLATIFNTIAPDEDRKRRVLTMTRRLLSEGDFGRSGQFQVLWTSMEELLVSYNDKPFVSEQYKTALDGAGARAEKMAAGELPPELPVWMDSLGQENVRSLSVALLIDLLTIEKDAKRAGEIAQDMAALDEDLLMSGAYADALTVTSALARRANSPLLGRDACRQALDRLGDSLPLRDTCALLGDVDEADWEAIKAVLESIGPPAIESLKPVVAVEADTLGVARAEATIVGFGVAAVTRLGSLVADPRWFVQRRAARLLGRIAAAEAVPLLQPLLRQADPRVAREAVAALTAVQDPAAARAIQTVLRAATGAVRAAVIDALVSGRDPRVVPVLTRIIAESDPLGKDHEMVLATAAALGAVGTDAAVAPLLALANRRKFLGGRKLRSLKECSVDAIVRIGTSHAQTALRDAVKSGDRSLKRIVTARLHG